MLLFSQTSQAVDQWLHLREYDRVEADAINLKLGLLMQRLETQHRTFDGVTPLDVTVLYEVAVW